MRVLISHPGAKVKILIPESSVIDENGNFNYVAVNRRWRGTRLLTKGELFLAIIKIFAVSKAERVFLGIFIDLVFEFTRNR